MEGVCVDKGLGFTRWGRNRTTAVTGVSGADSVQRKRETDRWEPPVSGCAARAGTILGAAG
jgi:hypothetical protein